MLPALLLLFLSLTLFSCWASHELLTISSQLGLRAGSSVGVHDGAAASRMRLQQRLGQAVVLCLGAHSQIAKVNTSDINYNLCYRYALDSTPH